ncbi:MULTISPECIES: ATP-binding protein [unclassified Streptomyces]|uniref:ATP-binding protein n=1 Tax=unclassified Streptomyces TaxID=2593676 RepID=UPI00336AA172
MIGVTDSAGAAGSGSGRARFVAWVLPAEPGAVRVVRSQVREALDGWGLTPLCDVTVLLVSELVTNALRHASGPIGVRMYARRERAARDPVLLVEVSDPLADPPRERVAAPEDESGRGLQLVAHSALRWGARSNAGGKTVWFELALPG